MLKLTFDNDVNLNEGTVVTFGGESYPTNGWAVCLAGGPGSGKGFASKQYFMLDFKSFDVDELKSKFNKAIKTLIRYSQNTQIEQTMIFQILMMLAHYTAL